MKTTSDLRLSVDGVFELDEGKALAEPGSKAFRKLVKAGWFTWDFDEDGNHIMTAIEGMPGLEELFLKSEAI